MKAEEKAKQQQEWLHLNDKRKCRRLSLDAMGILTEYEKLTAALEPIIEGYQSSIWEGWNYSPEVKEVAAVIDALQRMNNLVVPKPQPAWLFDEDSNDE